MENGSEAAHGSASNAANPEVEAVKRQTSISRSEKHLILRDEGGCMKPGEIDALLRIDTVDHSKPAARRNTAKTPIINVSDAPRSWNWLADRFTDERMVWHACSSHVSPRNASRWRTPASRLQSALAARALLRNNSGRGVIVSHGPLSTLYSEIIAHSRDALHLAFSFNFTNLPTGTRRFLFRRYLKRVDRFVVSSTMERALYSDYFDIDPKRIDLLLWSIRPPLEEMSKQPRFGSGRYICAIGSQARDYHTLIESMRHVPSIRLVLVASPDSLPQGPIPPNVTIMTNVPLADAMNVLAHSQFMVLPLRDSAVPCGHVTVVSALHMGKAVVATDSSGLHDYLNDSKSALLVPPRDPRQMADGIELLFDDQALCSRIGAEGREFAGKYCMEDNAVAYFHQFLNDNGIPVGLEGTDLANSRRLAGESGRDVGERIPA